MVFAVTAEVKDHPDAFRTQTERKPVVSHWTGVPIEEGVCQVVSQDDHKRIELHPVQTPELVWWKRSNKRRTDSSSG